jgi:hypothetical protein
VSAGGRQRLALVALLAGIALVTAFLEAVVMGPTGFHVQGRHLLPGLVLVPILSGAILGDHSERLSQLAHGHVR